MKRFLFAAFVVAIAAASSGCDSKGIERCSASGTVSVDGQPVESGAITFHPKSGTSSPVVGGTIQGGSFDIPKKSGPAPGEFELEIAGSRKTGRQIDVPGTGQKMDELEPAIPAKNAYPNGSEIPTATVKSGKNTFELKLTSGE